MIRITGKTTYGYRRNTDVEPQLLLLDAFPNAAAAYSLRLLRKGYTGNCIEVRRSSDNALQNIGFVNGVLDTASLLSFVGAGNGFVRTWYDQSGNGRDATQTTNGSQPQIVSSGSLILEGNKSTLSFNGSSNALTIDNFQTTSYSSVTVLAVNKSTDTTGARVIFGKYNSLSNNRTFWHSIRDNNLSSNASSDGISVVLRVDSNNINVNDYQLSALVFRGNQISNIDKIDFFKNSNVTNKTLVQNLNATSLFNASAKFSIGAEREGNLSFFQGSISEVIFYEFSQFSNIPAMHNISNNYYNIY